MDLINDPDLKALLAETVIGMLEYMSGQDEEFPDERYEVDYTEQHVERCRAILLEHLNSLDTVKTRDDAMQLVRRTVTSLNHLNESAGGQLIETDQRESICALIIKAGALKGFNDADEDLTEEWREW